MLQDSLGSFFCAKGGANDHGTLSFQRDALECLCRGGLVFVPNSAAVFPVKLKHLRYLSNEKSGYPGCLIYIGDGKLPCSVGIRDVHKLLEWHSRFARAGRNHLPLDYVCIVRVSC